MRLQPLQRLSEIARVLVICFVVALGPTKSLAEEYDGFTEPYRSVRVASPESGIIQVVHVRDGDRVKEGQILASLDNELHLAMLAIAKATKEATGGVRSAQAELELQQHRFEKLKTVREQGFARQEEVDRAAADVAISVARVQSAKESLLITRREYEKIKVQVERRIIRAPLDGVINEIQKRKGEYVGPNDPHLFHLVKLNPLMARFSLPSQRGRLLRKNQKIAVYLEPMGVTADAVIEFIGPVTDAESGTVEIKARIDNQDGRFFSGEQCILQFQTPSQPATLDGIANATSVLPKSN